MTVGIDTIGQLGGYRPGSSDAALVVALTAGALFAALAGLSRRLAATMASVFVGWTFGTVLTATIGSGHGFDLLAMGLVGALTGVLLVLLLSLDRCFLVVGTALAGAKAVIAADVLLRTGSVSIEGLADLARSGADVAMPALVVLTVAGVVVLLVVSAVASPMVARHRTAPDGQDRGTRLLMDAVDAYLED